MIPKNWGYEVIIHNGDYCCKKLVYTRRIASSLHYHEHKHETFYVLSGFFHLEVNETQRHMEAGEYVILPPYTRHRIRCLEQGEILESSTHDDPDDCVRLIPSET